MMGRMPRPRTIALGLALLALLAYLPAGRHGFLLYDDPDYLTENPVVRTGLTWAGFKWAFTSFHASNWHPLTWLSHMLDFELFGADAGAHHRVSALIHALNTVLLFSLARRMTGRVWASAVAALLFAWHPLHVQSVAWASERKDVLSAMFFFLSLRAYLRYARPEPGDGPPRLSWWWSLIWFTLGLLSKPMVVTLPFVLLLLDYWPLGRAQTLAQWGRLAVAKIPFFALSGLSCAITYAAQKSDAVIALEGFGLAARAQNAVMAYAAYLWKTIWPIDLSVIYPLARPPLGVWLGSLCLLLAISAGAWAARKSRPHLLMGWLFYLGTLVPVIGLVQVGGQSMADRYTYIPLTGIFLALAVEGAAWASRLRLPGRMVGAFAGVLLLACLAITTWQLAFWRDSETLFARALQVTGPNAIAESNMGAVREAQGRVEEARAHYLRALAINPRLPQAHNNLANLLDASGESTQAAEHYREALGLKPRAFLARLNFGGMLSRMGRHAESEEQLREAARLNPSDPRPWYLLGKSALRQEHCGEAAERFREALRRDPNHGQTLLFLARTLSASLDADVRNARQALALAEKLNQILPEPPPVVLDAIAMALAENGEFPRAAQVQQRAVALAGDAPEAGDLKRRLELYSAGKPFRAAGAELAR